VCSVPALLSRASRVPPEPTALVGRELSLWRCLSLATTMVRMQSRSSTSPQAPGHTVRFPTMKEAESTVFVIALLLILLSSPAVYGQDLSRYRSFSLGTSLANLSEQIHERSIDATTVHERPALIQQLSWWAPATLDPALRAQTIQHIRFSFYNGTLYKMLVTYDGSSTRGLTPEDIEHSLTAQYGTPAGHGGSIMDDYGRTEKALTSWEDSRYSLNLFRFSLSNSFGLVVFSKLLNANAAAASAEAVKLEQLEAPAKESARVKQEADELNRTRQDNVRIFVP